MITILHVSDLHFGRVDPIVKEGFLQLLREMQIDVSVVSGDFTQRAKKREFAQAAEFLKDLPEPHLVVPGNHDIPLFNVLRRFVSKLTRYKRYISHNLRPVIETDEIIIAGINTAHSLTIKDGRVTHAQIAHLKKVFAVANKTKILVTHHPLHMLQEDSDERVASRAKFAIEILRDAQVDVLLSGHYHQGTSGISTVHKEGKYDAILVQSGTSLSTRTRGQNNSFNVLKVDADIIQVEQFEWQDNEQRFAQTSVSFFERIDGRWKTKAGPD